MWKDEILRDKGGSWIYRKRKYQLQIGIRNP